MNKSDTVLGYNWADTFYPQSDGKPLAENTWQLKWIVLLFNNLEILLDGKMAFVAADLFWYPVEGKNKIVITPDVLIALGRPSVDRPSYQQWKEDDVAPQVVFEVISPSNTTNEMRKKLDFYEMYGVQEYIVIDPEKNNKEDFEVWERRANKLVRSPLSNIDWQSSLLGIRLKKEGESVKVYHPDGTVFKSGKELNQEAALKEEEIQRLKAKLKAAGLED